MQKCSKYLKVKLQKVKLHQNGPSECQKSIYSERLDKTESSKKFQQHDALGGNLGGGCGVYDMETFSMVSSGSRGDPGAWAPQPPFLRPQIIF